MAARKRGSDTSSAASAVSEEDLSSSEEAEAKKDEQVQVFFWAGPLRVTPLFFLNTTIRFWVLVKKPEQDSTAESGHSDGSDVSESRVSPVADWEFCFESEPHHNEVEGDQNKICF